MKIAIAGDGFIRASTLEAAVREQAGDEAELVSLETPWPVEPYSSIGGVEEASGDEDELAALATGAEVLVVHHAAVTRKVLHAARDTLRLVCCCRGGPVNVDVAAATEMGVPVCFAPGRNAAATAEFGVGLVLAALRHIPDSHAELSAGHWGGDHFLYDRAGREVEGAEVGLVGFGAVGSRVARTLAAMGATVLVHDPYADEQQLAAVGATAVGLDELLARSVVLSLHARVTDETRGMIGAAQLAALPEGAVVVNCARGALLDDDALVDALESGHLSAAALDVFNEEPPAPGSRVLSAPNLVHTPHIAGATRQVAEKAARIVAAEVGRHVRGEALANVADEAALRAKS